MMEENMDMTVFETVVSRFTKEACLSDHEMFCCAMKDNTKLGGHIVNLSHSWPDEVAESVEVRKTLGIPGMRHEKFDAIVKMPDGSIHDIEMRNKKEKDYGDRCAFRLFLLADCLAAQKGLEYGEEPSLGVIMIHAQSKGQEQVIQYDLCNLEKGSLLPPGKFWRIAEVNGKNIDDTPLGRFLHDIHESDWRAMEDPIMREVMRECKEGGKKYMGELLKSIIKEHENELFAPLFKRAREEERQEIARRALSQGLSRDAVAGLCGLDMNEVETIARGLNL